ncbi:MAG: hypothetical protein ABI471_11245 [Sphingomonas bacterium]
MKISALLIAGLLILGAQARPAHAQSIEEKQIATGKFSFDPASSYIYLHAPFRQAGMFLKVPDQADLDAYKKDWDAAFAKAKAKYSRQLANWEAEKKAASGTATQISAKPIEPTPETFTIGDIETRTVMMFGPQYVFSKETANNHYSYFMKVKPGAYIYYGPIMFDANAGFMGQCFCMGSVQFEVKPGVITDLGNFLIAGTFQTPLNPPAPLVSFTPEGTFLTMGKQKIEVGKFEWGLPASLKSFPSARADFHASGKMNNYYGIMVARMPAIPGILGYQRDKVIDLKAAAGAAAGVAQH